VKEKNTEIRLAVPSHRKDIDMPVDSIDIPLQAIEDAPVCRECGAIDAMTLHISMSLSKFMNDYDLEFDGRYDADKAIWNLLNNVIDWPPLCREHAGEIEPPLGDNNG